MQPAGLVLGPYGERVRTVRWQMRRESRSLRWPAAVAALFVLAQLLLVTPGSVLGWDETVYVSQVGPQAPAAFFSAPRARGISFLVAPVATLTSSTDALRVYLALLSGCGLFLGLAVWRRLLPTPVLAGAGALFASLWITQFYGPQVMPNLWVALAALIAVGCFLRVVRRDDVTGLREGRGPLVGLVASVAFAALMRPADAAWLVLPLALAALAVRDWRRPSLVLALAAGLLLGSAEWVVEAYVSYGGLTARLHLASEIQGNMGWQLAFGHQVRGLEGRALCRPCDVPWRHPSTAVWWFALPVLVAGGVLASVRNGRAAVLLLPTLTGLSLSVPYLFMIGYAAPRFLLPTYLLLALPVAYGVSRVVRDARSTVRPVAVLVVAAVLALHLSVQYGVLDEMTARSRAGRVAQDRVVGLLRGAGIRPPCLVTGEHAVQVAYGTGCSSRQVGGHDRSITLAGVAASADSRPVAVLVAGKEEPPPFARGWRLVRLPVMVGLHEYRAYLSPSTRPA